MKNREEAIKGLEQFIEDFKQFCGNRADWKRVYDALSLLKAQEQEVVNLTTKIAELTTAQKAYWILCEGRGHNWRCSNCGGKINYNDEKKYRQKSVLPVWLENKYCRWCGHEMTSPPADE